MLTQPSDLSRKKDDHRGMVYVGTVVANDDPLRLKRIRISIPELLEGSGEELPWAIPSTTAYGTFVVPEVGSPTYVTFQNGNLHYPMYSGEVSSSQHPIPYPFNLNYPNKYGFGDSQGNHFYVDRQSNVVEFHHTSGTTFRINADGSISSNAGMWTHTGNITLQGNLEVSGNVDIGGNATVVQAVVADTVEGLSGVVQDGYELGTHWHHSDSGVTTRSPRYPP